MSISKECVSCLPRLECLILGKSANRTTCHQVGTSRRNVKAILERIAFLRIVQSRTQDMMGRMVGIFRMQVQSRGNFMCVVFVEFFVDENVILFKRAVTIVEDTDSISTTSPRAKGGLLSTHPSAPNLYTRCQQN
jgi:hypothetical protein